MDVGTVLSEASAQYRRHLVRFVLTAAVVLVAVELVSAVARSAANEGAASALVWGLISVAVTLVGLFWVQGALVETVRDVRHGEPETGVAEVYARTQKHLAALIVAGVLAGIGVGIGLLLLVVPGLYLLTRWSLVVPVIVLEDRRAGESFSRSSELVSGHGWEVFGVVIATLVGGFVARVAIVALLAPFLPELLEGWIGGLVASSLVFPFVALAWTTMYYRLQETKA